jgi:hypothetical protein
MLSVELGGAYLPLRRCLALVLLAWALALAGCAQPLHPGKQGLGGATGGGTASGGIAGARWVLGTGGVLGRGGGLGAGGVAGAGGTVATGGAVGTGGVPLCAADRSLVTLASGRKNVWNGIAIDGAGVYWTERPGSIPYDQGTGNGRVMSVSLGGGPPTILASDQDSPSQIHADGAYVYWTTWYIGAFSDGNTSVMRALPKGSKPAWVFSLMPEPDQAPVYGDIAVVASSLYWAYQGNAFDDYVDGSILAVSLADGSHTTLASGLQRPYEIAADASNVYFVIHGPSSNERKDVSLSKVPILGGPVTVLDVSSSSHTAIALGADNIYWTSYTDGTVMKMPLTGGPPVTLASGQSGPDQIAVDATSVYWSNRDDGILMKVALGGGTPETLCSDLFLDGLAVDATSIYWASSGPSDNGHDDGFKYGTVTKLTPK